MKNLNSKIKQDNLPDIIYVGSNNPKVVFIMDIPNVKDINSTKPFSNVFLKEYRLLRESVNRIGLNIEEEVGVLYVFNDPNIRVKKDKLFKMAENRTNIIFNYISEKFNKDVFLIPVGAIPIKLLLNIKNIFNVSGTLKNRIINGKKYQVIPLVSPASCFIYKKNAIIYERSISTIKKIINEEVESDLRYEVITEDKLIKFTKALLRNRPRIPYLIFDIETSSLIHHECEVIGVSLTTPNTDKCYYIPTIKNKSLCRKCIGEIIKTFPLVGHNIKFDLVMLMLNDYIKPKEFKIYNDTMIMAHIIDNKRFGSLSLKDLAKLYFFVVEDWDKPLDEFRSKYAKEHKMKKKDVSYAVIPPEIISKYACLDVYYTKKLYNFYIEKINNEKDFIKLNNNLIKEETAVLYWEYQGCVLDKEVFNKLSDLVLNKRNIALYKLNELAEKYGMDSFNPNSPLQVAEMFKKLNIKSKKKTKAGNIKTDIEVLNELIKSGIEGDKKEFIQAMIDYKYYDKAYTSYIKPIPKETSPEGIFRTSFKVCGTTTGRLSSYLHTLPSRTALGKNFKKLVKSRMKNDGFILSADFSQLEPRVLASLSGDENLINVYVEGKDIYKYMASEVYHKSYDDITKNERNSMKSLVLAIMYGMSPSTFAERIGCSQEEAEKIFENFFKKFRKVKIFIDSVHRFGFKYGGIKTYHGRFIPIETLNKIDAKRKMQNYIIQSTASELALFQFSDISLRLIEGNYKSRVINSVHDSIVIDCHKDEFLKVYNILIFYTNKIIKVKYPFIKVPMKVDVAIGTSWGSSLDINDFSNNIITVEGFRCDLDNLLKVFNYKDVEIIEEKEIEVEEDLIIDNNLYGQYKIFI